MRDPQSQSRLPVLPDAVFDVAFPDGAVQYCLLDVDMGTLTLDRFRRKVRTFALYLERIRAAAQWPSDFGVLVLTHSEPRLRHLWRAARAEVPEERWSACSFATFDLLDPPRFGGARSATLRNDLVPLLYDDAFPPPVTPPRTR
jgi:hypothetical protein